jgi:hypothetical protein
LNGTLKLTISSPQGVAREHVADLVSRLTRGLAQGLHNAARRLQKSVQNVQDRRLAAAAAADEHDEFAAPALEVEVAEDRLRFPRLGIDESCA